MQPTVGHQLQRARLQRGWSLNEMHRRTGLHIKTIKKAEADEGVFDYIVGRLAKELDLDVTQLLDEAAS